MFEFYLLNSTQILYINSYIFYISNDFTEDNEIYIKHQNLYFRIKISYQHKFIIFENFTKILFRIIRYNEKSKYTKQRVKVFHCISDINLFLTEHFSDNELFLFFRNLLFLVCVNNRAITTSNNLQHCVKEHCQVSM